MTGASRPDLRRPRPGAEKAAFDAWQAGATGRGAALRILQAARVRPRDQADFLRHVIGLPDADIAEHLAPYCRPPRGGGTPVPSARPR
jgi:hypothetical protein